MSWPQYDDLPPVDGMPKGCAWGVFDKDGEKDRWPIGAIRIPLIGRKGLVHRSTCFLDQPHEQLGFLGYDDEIEFNTQNSSHWDSLCHYLHQGTGQGYNGAEPTVHDLSQRRNTNATASLPTLEHWHTRGGLVGRGVLIDYKAYADANGINYSPFSNHKITISDIEAVAVAQNVSFQAGDVFIVHTRYTEALGCLSPNEQAKAMSSGCCVGIEGNEEAAKWFWNQGFSAVAGDQVAFEVFPFEKDVLHQYFLALFGLHIGELWDLRTLSETCARLSRYTFFFTSVPLHVPGSVASPPNALAIF
ncbi:hypothetical protein MYCGRDRAFT_103601 [Paecilomyces variotii No. 5]|uniref:Cyclase-domain-containing protein n=1 Tax=Byssochlamys spectabilis (strain No. 5 / NBRC 109023) TaxID=1356009 RepID=V5FWW5_BYSSN|nr:hypothetical protein MYCGRDRAFT_103601 [Paecilomyces variotii No. 5]